MKARVLAAWQRQTLLPEGEPLPDLQKELDGVCRERFRRVDRFVQLALLGSAHCLQGRQVDPACGLYLHSGCGPLSINIDIQQGMLRDRQIPKPFQFVNTLGSSSLYYTARNLQLKGPSLWVGRRRAGFMTVLPLALADLATGRVPQALLGAVEEATLPLDDHRRRVGMEPDSPVAEGTAWAWLAPWQDGSGPGLEWLRFASLEEAALAIGAQKRPGERLRAGQSLQAGLAEALGLELDTAQPSSWHDSLDASLAAGWLQDPKKNGGLWMAAGSAEEGIELLHLFA